ncbi:MAG: hypothetical protein AAFO28_04770 [Pseudomonadota bacterium]
MTQRPILIASFALATLVPLSACTQSDGIDSSGAIYDGVSSDASFTALGTEPFWGLDIEAEDAGQHAARFTRPEDIDGSAFTLTRFAGNNGLGFSGELDGKAVQVAITPGDCSDGMSDRSYPFVVTLALGEAVLRGCAYTSEAPFTGPEDP